jgi:hypothetical protein
MPGTWNTVYGCVPGTSHEVRGEPCQDAALVRVVSSAEGAALVATCADGAGSAEHSRFGSQTACRRAVAAISGAIEDGLSVRDIEKSHIGRWYEHVRSYIAFEACIQNLPIREFACTLLVAIVGEQRAVFAQIGDGAIVINEDGLYRPVFWPQSGEYANTTTFVTADNYAETIACCSVERPVDDLALFTDGLQSLALHYATKSAHSPFFAPMFHSLRNAPAAEELVQPLKDFLSSPAVNDRTDDDKTLVLASRTLADNATS